MSTHTPVPWERNIPPASHYPTIFAGRNKHVCTMSVRGMDPAQVEANMEFLLRAVNCHEDLLAACERLLRAADNSNCDSGACDAARAAIAKATATQVETAGAT